MQTSHDLPATLDMHKRSIDHLERSLNRDNHREEQPVAEPVAIIPGFEEEAIEGKLWTYFLGRVQAVGGKVEKEQVNCREKQFSVIRQQVADLLRNYAQQAAQLEAVVREKYKQVHGLFEEIKLERTLKVAVLAPKVKKSKKDPPMLDNSERLVTLKEQVQEIRTDVTSLELQVGRIRLDAEKLKREWTTFLQHLLRGGYYLKDGMENILREMIEADYVPTADDMPSLLDETSKRFLLQEYDHLKSNGKRLLKLTPLRLERSRILSEARQSLSEIARKNLVREVYKDTQDFMANLVKMPDWRTTNLTLPKIKAAQKSEAVDWKEHERKRIGFVYTGEDLIKARGILFGWRAPPP
jgi:hypothetical protein